MTWKDAKELLINAKYWTKTNHHLIWNKNTFKQRSLYYETPNHYNTHLSSDGCVQSKYATSAGDSISTGDCITRSKKMKSISVSQYLTVSLIWWNNLLSHILCLIQQDWRVLEYMVWKESRNQLVRDFSKIP